jgi:hypothetical protein
MLTMRAPPMRLHCKNIHFFEALFARYSSISFVSLCDMLFCVGGKGRWSMQEHGFDSIDVLNATCRCENTDDAVRAHLAARAGRAHVAEGGVPLARHRARRRRLALPIPLHHITAAIAVHAHREARPTMCAPAHVRAVPCTQRMCAQEWVKSAV